MVGNLHHEFSCFKDKDKNIQCKGFGRSPDSSALSAIFSSVPGVILTGAENFATANNGGGMDNECTKDDNNSCMDSCINSRFNSLQQDTPRYGWFQQSAQQCQAVNRDIVSQCKTQCRVQ